MITRIQKSGGMTHSALEYNEDKVSEDVATVVAVNAIADASWFSIHEAFREREALPSVDPRIMNVLLHLTVNPGVDDDMTREGAESYIRELMEELGYGGQPYVVYRHNDIEREHYHIVASNILPDGHAVDTRYINLRVMRIQDNLAKKYGFTPGLPDGEAAPKKYKPGFIHKGDDGVLARMRTNIDEVFRYRCRDGLQLRAALLSFGMELRGTTAEDGRTYYMFRCKDENGALTKRPVSIKRAAGVDTEGFMKRMGALFEKNREARTPNPKTVEAIRKALDDTRLADGTLDTFRRRLRAEGISLFATTADKKLPARAGQEADFLFVDGRRREVVTLMETGLKLSDILSLTNAAATRKKKDDVLDERKKKKQKAPSRSTAKR